MINLCAGAKQEAQGLKILFSRSSPLQRLQSILRACVSAHNFYEYTHRIQSKKRVGNNVCSDVVAPKVTTLTTHAEIFALKLITTRLALSLSSQIEDIVLSRPGVYRCKRNSLKYNIWEK